MIYPKRIACNTLWLYLRLAVVTASDLVTVRLLLRALGLETYGVFAAATTFCAALLFLDGTLREMAQRFISVELGRNQERGVGAAFSSAVGIALVIAILVVIGGEAGGIWYVCNRLDLPPESRAMACRVVHLGVVTAAVRTLVSPLETLVLSLEKMGTVTGVAVIERLLMVAAAAALPFVPAFRPEVYAGLLLAVAAVVWTIYVRCARRACPDARFVPSLGNGAVASQASFLSWSVLSSIGHVVRYQGVGLLIGSLTGTALAATWNVTMGLGFKLYSIVGVFQLAYFSPVVKVWATGDLRRFFSAIGRTSGWSLVLMSVCAVPLLIWPDAVLSGWLGANVPPQASSFLRCVALHFLLDALNLPLHTAIVTVGRVAVYQTVTALLMVMSAVCAGALLSSGFPAWTALAAVAAGNGLTLAYRAYAIISLRKDLRE